MTIFIYYYVREYTITTNISIIRDNVYWKEIFVVLYTLLYNNKQILSLYIVLYNMIYTFMYNKNICCHYMFSYIMINKCCRYTPPCITTNTFSCITEMLLVIIHCHYTLSLYKLMYNKKYISLYNRNVCCN